MNIFSLFLTSVLCCNFGSSQFDTRFNNRFNTQPFESPDETESPQPLDELDLVALGQPGGKDDVANFRHGIQASLPTLISQDDLDRITDNELTFENWMGQAVDRSNIQPSESLDELDSLTLPPLDELDLLVRRQPGGNSDVANLRYGIQAKLPNSKG
jgi:hypothetical protein